jgi:hypothetical protein
MDPLPKERWDEWLEGRPPEIPTTRLVENCPNRVKRLTALGNGQVPEAMARAWLSLSRF